VEVSKATASRDFALVRRIHRQFGRMLGRSFDPKSDKIFWSWDWSYYGFIAPESSKAGYLEPVGPLPVRHSQTGKQRVVLRVQSVGLAQQQIDLTVKHARPDQGANANL
jgi:hypothetical protein